MKPVIALLMATSGMCGHNPRLSEAELKILDAKIDAMYATRKEEGTETEFVCRVRPLPPSRDGRLGDGDMIILGQDAGNALRRRKMRIPWSLKATNEKSGMSTHVSTKCMDAPDDECHIPRWMMRDMGLLEGDSLKLEHAQLPVGTSAKLKLITKDAFELMDPGALVKQCLVKAFGTLTQGTNIVANTGPREYVFEVVETQPARAIFISGARPKISVELPDYLLDRAFVSPCWMGSDLPSRPAQPIQAPTPLTPRRREPFSHRLVNENHGVTVRQDVSPLCMHTTTSTR